MPCENNHSAICNSTQKIYYALYMRPDCLALRTIFVDSDDHAYRNLPIAHTYDDLHSIMVDIDYLHALRFEYKHHGDKIFDFISSYSSFSIFVVPKDLDQYFLCKGLLFQILFYLVSLLSSGT